MIDDNLNDPNIEDTIDEINNIKENHITEENEQTKSVESIENTDNILNSDVDNTTNCLALTVRENYHIVAVKNFFRKGTRISWKVTLSIFVINFLNMFL